ncbi:hypothetical protein F5Y03DRAFT_369932, partial [Xylaria venustula]
MEIHDDQSEAGGSIPIQPIRDGWRLRLGCDDPTSPKNIGCFWDGSISGGSRERTPRSSQVEIDTSDGRDAKIKKRIFICCDGTWQNAIGTNRPLTNVARFAYSVTPTDDNGITQIIYYASGIGSKPDNTTKMPKSPVEWAFDLPAMGQRLGDRYTKYFGGGTGAGITGNILNAYYFLCLNYNFRDRKDEIILAGFSRGAYTVRCPASFISCVGLLRRKGLSFLQELFKGWKDERGSSQAQKDKFQQKIRYLKDSNLLFETKVTVCAEWDSVSAVWSPDLSHVQDMVPKNVENAFHAVALHEKRGDFQPVLWRSREDRDDEKHSIVKQCLFFGCHSDVGGGNADPGLATVSLLWIVSQVRSVCTAKFDERTLLSFFGPKVTKVRRPRLLGPSTTHKLDLESMECHVFTKGEVEDSYQSLWWVRGKSPRRLLLFPCPEPCTSHKPQCAARPLMLTIHFSVHILMTKRNEPCEVLDGYEFNQNEGRWEQQGDRDNVVFQNKDEIADRIEQEWLRRWYMRGWTIVARGAKKDTLDEHYFNLNLVPKPLPQDREKSLIELLKENNPRLREQVREALERKIETHSEGSEDWHEAWAWAETDEWDSEDRSELEPEEQVRGREEEREHLGLEQGRATSIGPGSDGMRARRQNLGGMPPRQVKRRNQSV